jgi:hypothetical protein
MKSEGSIYPSPSREEGDGALEFVERVRETEISGRERESRKIC